MGLFSTLKLLQQSDSWTENGKALPDPVKNPSVSQRTINITVLLMRRKSPISFRTRTIYGTWIQQVLCHSTKILKGTLYRISTFKRYFNNLEQAYIRCSVHCNRWTAKGSDCASALRSSKEITYRTDQWTKQFLRLKSWVIFGSPEEWTMGGVPAFVMKCSCV